MHNSSYSFMLILLKLHRCFGHGLKSCMWFGYNPQIIFCHFFCNLNSVFFSGIITINICRQYVPCEGNSSYKFYIFRWFLISLKNLGGGHKFSEFACLQEFQALSQSERFELVNIASEKRWVGYVHV